MHIFIQFIWRLCFTFRPAFSASYITIQFSLLFTKYIIPTDYIPTIPPLIRRGVSKSEHVSESFKIFSSKCFGEDVWKLIIFGTMSKMDYLGLYMMLNQIILCVDVFGSIMEYRILSQLDYRSMSINNGVEFSCFSWKYSSIFLRHTISFVASATATYSASVVESAGTDCLRDLHEIAADPRLMVYPEVDTPVSLSPSKSESDYPISLKSSTLEYLSPTSWVPFKYIRTLFAAEQCPSQGLCMNLESMPTT